MNKRIFILITLLFYTNIKSSQILNISIPKSGTFLLMRTLELITHMKCHVGLSTQIYTPPLQLLQESMQHCGFSCLHLVFNSHYESFLKETGCRACFIVRDPRDLLVSQVYFMLKYSPDHGRFNFDSLLSALIGDNDKSPQDILTHFLEVTLDVLSPQEYISHIKRYYEGFLGWQNSETCYTTRFEDLVGPMGGGTIEQQRREVANIAKHIGADLNEEQVTDICSNIFGSTWSFREGKIGSWKTHFKEEHKQAFKTVAGDLLERLGYEPYGNNW